MLGFFTLIDKPVSCLVGVRTLLDGTVSCLVGVFTLIDRPVSCLVGIRALPLWDSVLTFCGMYLAGWAYALSCRGSYLP